MNIYNKYARYADLLWRDKDYEGESEYIHTLIQKYVPKAKNILDLGCGTGRHAMFLSGKGYKIHGIDLSVEMLKRAKRRLKEIPFERASKMSFSQGDIRNIKLSNKFDAVVSLFHVMTYQPTNNDLECAFKTAYCHLKKGGVFIFDCWYGPAVLTDPPVVRVKRVEDESIKVTRITEPVMHANENLVDLNNHFFICEKSSGITTEFEECHRMRYLFIPELYYILERVGFEVKEYLKWLSFEERPSYDSWYICLVTVR